MFKTQNDKLKFIQPGLIIVGIDIAKAIHWAQAIQYNGILIGKPFTIDNTREGFQSLLETFAKIQQETGCRQIIVGLEPTGHYWKTLAWFLKQHDIKVVFVNPYHVKKSKELDDNSQTKSDPKDAKTIARLVRDGRFSITYIPQGSYGELRVLSNTRSQLMKKLKSVKNVLIAVLDEYFPEYNTVFKDLCGKASLHILFHCPFPEDIKRLGISGIVTEFKKAVKRSVGLKRAELLYNTAIHSIGMPVNNGARLKIRLYIQELQSLTLHIETIEREMEVQLNHTGVSKYILSIPGIGIVAGAGILGEIGDPSRFVNWKQIRKLAGLNLVEDSSGQRKGRRVISKRGRPALRSFLYQVVLVLVAGNKEFRLLYHYLISRKENPLKKKQALIILATKLIRVIITLITKKKEYDASKVLGEFREHQLNAA